jgi:alpha/beta hydrolase fold
MTFLWNYNILPGGNPDSIGRLRCAATNSAGGRICMNKSWLASFLHCTVPLAAREPSRPTVTQQYLQDPSAEPQTMPLRNGKARGALGDAESARPTITLYATSSGHTPTAAVIVFPGGGYGHLATNHEGRQIATWLNAAGITAFVVKFRLGPRYHHPVELGDAQHAIRLVRSRARESNVLPDKIGVLGFFAGGHLASTTETHFDLGNPQVADPIDRASSRPDFAVLAYPVISFRPVAEPGSRFLITPSGSINQAMLNHIRSGGGMMGSTSISKHSLADVVELNFELHLILFADGEIAGPDPDHFAAELQGRKRAAEFVVKQVRLARAEGRDVTAVLTALAEAPSLGGLGSAQGDPLFHSVRNFARYYLRRMHRKIGDVDLGEAALRHLENRPAPPNFYRRPKRVG